MSRCRARLSDSMFFGKWICCMVCVRFINPKRCSSEAGKVSRHQTVHDFPECLGIEKRSFHFLGRVVVGLQTECLPFGVLGERFQFRMDKIIFVVENARLAEQNVCNTCFEFILNEFRTFEPDKFNGLLAIAENGRQPCVAPLALFAETRNLPFDLDVSLVIAYFADTVKARAVNVFVRVEMQQIFRGIDFHFRLQQFGALRPDPRQILDVLIGKFHVSFSLFASAQVIKKTAEPQHRNKSRSNKTKLPDKRHFSFLIGQFR